MKDILIKCLETAGQIQTDHFQKIETVSLKEKISSIVTDVDIKCDEAIVKILREHFPTHNVLTEERGFVDQNSNYTWIIDPLDGTSNYASGLPWFGVLIAVLESNTPVLGGAYIPMADKMYIAEAGKGAYLSGEKLAIREQKPEDSLVAFSTDATKDEEYLDKGLGIYRSLVQNCRNVRSTNSLVDLMNVAENKFGACINLFNGIWDIAAPFIIIREAGGIFTDLFQDKLVFRPDPKNLHANYPIMTGSALIVEKLKKIIRRSLLL
jgi:myo-inositol-1(or 4)-monophosphatase